LKDKENHIFKEYADFDTAFKIYKFDRDFRNLILRELEKIEIAIRSKMTYNLCHAYSPFWFRDNTIFKSKFDLDKCLESLLYDIDCDEKFLRSFQLKYSNSFPPSWMTLELTTFGTLSTLHMGLKPGLPKREISHYFGLDDKTFSSWLHTFVYLRNVCAHHARLWNREMSITPRLPLTPQRQWLKGINSSKNDRLYFAISMMLYLLQTIDPENKMIYRFKILLKKYPNIDVAAMGFPSDWETEPLWNAKLSTRQKLRLFFTFRAK
jgi:abortive infection bacteriophage resistance protein